MAKKTAKVTTTKGTKVAKKASTTVVKPTPTSTIRVLDGETVVNMRLTTDDKLSRTWIEMHGRATRHMSEYYRTCCNYGCNKPGDRGAHVKINSSEKTYIIPLCAEFNHHTYTETMNVKKGTIAMRR
jgi:hypothetical protein